jgi:drug/metabolite transporter (DMT)-like permease
MLSVWFLGDLLNRWEIIGTLVAILGVGLTIALQTPIEPAMSGLISLGKGDLLTLFGVSAGAIATVISKAKLGHIPLGPFTILRTLIATVVFFVLALGLYGSNHFAEAFSPLLWQWMLGYGVVIVAIGQLLWYRGVRESTSSEVSLVNSFSPIAGILAAALILKELPTTAQYLGGAVILVGIILTQLGIWRKSIHRTPITNPSTMQAAEAGIGFKGT